MMKVGTGWALTFLTLILFTFLFVEVTAEVNNMQTVEQLLDNKVELDNIHIPNNSYILDQNGALISEVFRDKNTRFLPFEQLPQWAIDAFLSTEDKRFFDHKGYDASSIARAFLSNVQSNDIEQGASTITQQLARNLFLGHEQTYNRKLNELLYAYELEKIYSKENILELYLNTIYFQNGVYGIEAASQFYFNKPSSELTLGEVTYLTAVPNNPTHYNPLTNGDNTKLRQEWMLEKMLEEETISESEYEEALAEDIRLNVQERVDRFPDYVTYVHDELKRLVSVTEGYQERLRRAESEEQKASIENKMTERVEELLAEGITIETALDPAMQQTALEAVSRQRYHQELQGSAVVIDHHAHEIVAITGGNDFQKFDFHRGYQSYRQPGSAIKPLLVFAPYLEELDVPIQSTINADSVCKGDYCPQNFGGGQYGNVTLETAFRMSYNTPAIRILDRVGIETAFNYLEPFQFEKVTSADVGFPAALGGFTHGMSTLELTSAYTTFGNAGTYKPSYAIRKVLDREGNLLMEWEKAGVQAWSEQTNERMKSLLSSVVSNGTGRRAYVQQPYVGGKTGTTNTFHDLWFVGLTDRYTAGVWVGYDQPRSLQSINHRTPNQLIWRDLMRSY